MREFDLEVFYWINRWPDAWSPVFHLLSEANKQTWFRVTMGLLVLAMVWRKGAPRKTALLAMAAWPLSNEITDQLKGGFQMLRPCVELADAFLRVERLTSFGTASAHAANMAAIAYVFCRYLGPWGVPWVIVAFLTGLSRVYVGVHYPSQVLFGWLCGTFAAFLVTETYEAFVRWRDARRREDAPA
ncbi:MAG: phosphatase PAP2 family protein [Fimbriimonadaceae bacterium]|nr:phosphatase PAP2 family protein [Fimbriimonadaceae bacterium]